MAWTSLESRLPHMPLVLAGPMLRQVTKESVTVWIALKTKADVTLIIYDGDKAPARRELGRAKRTPTAIGKNLFIVAVTARTTEPLVEANIYFYDLQFTSVGPPMMQSLAEAISKPGDPQDISRIAYYPTYQLPSFAMPPADLNKLRLIQGSCRKPNGGTKDQPEYPETPDALGFLDVLIADSVDNPFERPHQLLLTGDQIYADEVADVLLAMLIDAADVLMGWKEVLPGGSDDWGSFGPYDFSKLPPTTRNNASFHAGLSSDDTRSHLMFLGEYLAMYLFVWSDELFIPTPTIDEFKALFPAVTIDGSLLESMITQRNAVEKFRESLGPVRRALSNIPSYMICDDHEITDDWNMTRRFCDKVYGSALGRRIIQNGLIAFAICQSWGNLPEQFWDQTPAAGARLLNSLEAVTRAEVAGTHIYDTFDDDLQTRVGIHDAGKMAGHTPYAVFHDSGPHVTINGISVDTVSLRFNFSVEGPSHQVIVTDSRTNRQFRLKGKEDHPDLIGVAELRKQLFTDVPRLEDRLLLIVTTTNIPPTAGIREAASILSDGLGADRRSARYDVSVKFLYKFDVNDSWEFPALATDHVFAVVSDKFPSINGILTGQAVFLSGDVHFSFATRVGYWAEKQRLGDTPGNEKKVKAVFGQLVASALKNEKDDTRGMQDIGYGYVPRNFLKHIAWTTDPQGYFGWNYSGSSKKIGRLRAGLTTPGITWRISGEYPTCIKSVGIHNRVTLNDKPDWR